MMYNRNTSDVSDVLDTDGVFKFLSYEDKKKNDYKFIDDEIKRIGTTYNPDFLAKTKAQIRANYMIGNGMSPLEISKFESRHRLRVQGNATDNVAADIHYHDVLRRILTRMWGENQKRPLNPKVIDSSGYNQNVRKKHRLKLFQDYMKETIFQPAESEATREISMKYGVEDITQLKPEDQEQLKLEVDESMKFKLPSDIHKHMRDSYTSPSEAQLSRLITWAKNEFGIKFITSESYKDLTLSGFEACYIGVSNNQPIIEIVNPENFTFFNPTSSPFIEDSEWWINEKQLTFSKYVREYLNTPDKLKAFKTHVDEFNFKDIKSGQLSDGGKRAIYDGRFNSVNMQAKFIDSTGNLSILPDVSSPEGQQFFGKVEAMFGSTSLNMQGTYTAKHNVFTSFDKLYYVQREDPKNKLRLKGFWVGENYSKNERLDIKVEEFWFPALYEGVELGNGSGLIVNKQRVPFQNRSINDPRKLYSPFIGVEFSKLHGNTPRIAPVDLGKTIAYKVNKLENKIEELDESNLGRIFTFANEAVPANWTIEQVMEVAKKSKFVPIDLARLGELGFSNVAAQLFKSVDVSNDDYINTYIQRKQVLERECVEAMSYSPSQMGYAPASMTATNNQQNIIQGSYATEDINYLHRTFEERLLEAFANLIRNGLRYNDHLRTYLLDDLGVAELELDEELLDLAEIGIKIASELDDINDVNSMKAHLQPLIQNGMVDFYESAVLQFSKEPSAIINIAREAKERIEKANKEKQEQEYKLAQQEIDRKKELDKQAHEYKMIELELKKLDIEMRGDQFRKVQDADLNTVPDSLQKAVVDNQAEMERLVYETENAKEIKKEEMKLEFNKLKADMEMLKAELEVRKKELANKNKQK